MKKKIRIGNAGGYWGDDLDALRRQLTGGPLDYITMDFLAEITMSILRKQQLKNPELGYARDFLTQLETCLPLIVAKNVKVITNAGGINPVGLGREIVALALKMGFELKVGVVYGDDIADRLDELTAAGEKFTNMETGAEFGGVRDRIIVGQRLPRRRAGGRRPGRRLPDHRHRPGDRHGHHPGAHDPRIRLGHGRLGPHGRRHRGRAHHRVRSPGLGREHHRLAGCAFVP